MNSITRYLVVFVALLFLVPAVSAFGYGTSSISFTQSSGQLAAGGSMSVGYNVSLATGSTWGTTINIVNKAQLASHGITVTLSNPGGTQSNPPFNGTMTISVSSSTPNGQYNIILNATGDDPSTTNAAFALAIAVPASSSTTTVTGAASTTVAVTSSVAVSAPASYGMDLPDVFLGLIILVIIITVISMAVKTATASRQILLCVALILVGTFLWLYGDYTGGALYYVWAGVILILIGTFAWIWVDHQAHLL